MRFYFLELRDDNTSALFDYSVSRKPINLSVAETVMLLHEFLDGRAVADFKDAKVIAMDKKHLERAITNLVK